MATKPAPGHGLFAGDDEPSLRVITREAHLHAYEEELRETPPTQAFAGDETRAVRARKAAAYKDMTRFERAAARLGCRIQLVPDPTIKPARQK